MEPSRQTPNVRYTSGLHQLMTDSSKTATSAISVKSAARFADILEYVADAAEPPGFAEIAAGLGVPKSSLFHLLNTMVSRGYLQQSEGRGGYRLGLSIAKLASRMQRPASYGNRAQVALNKLSEQINETSVYYELVGDEAEAIKVVPARQALVYTLEMGDRAPLYCISAGKVFLANMPTDELHAYLKRTKPKKFTENTLTTPRAILKELKNVRETGFAYSHQEYSLGIIGIAAPVTVQGVVVGAVSIALPSVRHTPELDGRIRRALMMAASAIGSNS